MPYIYKELLEDGDLEADVVTREDYVAVIQDRDELIVQRDSAIERAETAERGWQEAKNKYADAFLTSPARVKKEQEADVKRDGTVTSFEQLFNMKEGY